MTGAAKIDYQSCKWFGGGAITYQDAAIMLEFIECVKLCSFRAIEQEARLLGVGSTAM
jgi:hypothetical protein